MGLAEEEFVACSGALSDTIKCSLCLGVFADPVCAFGRPCHCTFCRSCISKWLDTQSSCPNCRKSLQMDMMEADIKVQSFIDEQHVFCSGRAMGCFWTGRYDARPGHEDACVAKELSSLKRQAEEDKGIIAALTGQKRLVEEQESIIAALTEQLEIKEKDNEQLKKRIKRLDDLQAWFSKSFSSAPPYVRELLQSCVFDDPGSSDDHVTGSPCSSREAPKKHMAWKEGTASSSNDHLTVSPDSSRAAPKNRKPPLEEWHKKGPAREREELQEHAKLKRVMREGCECGVDMADTDGLQFFCLHVQEPQGDLELLLESMKAMNWERQGASGHIGKMIFSDGLEKLAVVAYVPEEKRAACSCEDWLKSVLRVVGGEIKEITRDLCSAVVTPNQGQCHKMRDQMMVEASHYLRKRGLFPESDALR